MYYLDADNGRKTKIKSVSRKVAEGAKENLT